MPYKKLTQAQKIESNQKKKDKVLINFNFRLKDSNKHLQKELYTDSGSVNFVWNFCNSTQQEAVKRHRKWLSKSDFHKLTTGSSQELGLYAQTVQAVYEEYVTRRVQFKKPWLKFRTNKKNRNLPWIPFKAEAIKIDDKGTISYKHLKIKTWYSRKIPSNYELKSGNFVCDNLGHWFVNLVFEIKMSKEEKEQYDLMNTSKGQNISGGDFGLNPMLTLSTENADKSITYREINSPKWYRDNQLKLARYQRYNKNKAVKKLHKKIKNQRKDYHYKLANDLIADNHTIVMGDLSLKSLMQTKMKGHAKAWHDLGVGYFSEILKTKARKHSVRYEKVSERVLKSTQTCSQCKSLTGPKGRKGLSVSAWDCPGCGAKHRRNENSATNHRLALPMQVSINAKEKVDKKLSIPETANLTVTGM